MKKLLSLLAVIAIAFSFCSCGTPNENNMNNSASIPVSNEPLRPDPPSRQALEQAVVNRCCEASDVSRVSITYGLFDTSWDEESNVWVTYVKGTYYPVDDFGEYEDKMKFGVKLHGTRVVEITDSFWYAR